MKKNNFGVLIMYIFGFLSVTIVELLTINEVMGESSGSIGFDFNLIKRLPSLLTSYFAIICYTVATLQGDIIKFKSNNDEFCLLKNKITTFARDSYRPSLFNQFAYIINTKRKANAWKKKITKKWSRMEQRQSDKDFAFWLDYLEKKSKLKEGETLEIKNRYVLKRLKLEKAINDNYIKENINTLPVKFNAINSGLVLGGIKKGSISLEEDEYINKHPGLMVVIERGPTSIASIAIISMITSITIDAFTITAHWVVWAMFLLKLLTKIYSLLNTVYSMHKYSESYNEKVTLKDIRFRCGIIYEYEAWVKKRLNELNLKKEEELEHVTTNTAEQISKPVDGRQVNIVRAEPNIDTRENQRNSIVDEENNMQHPVLVSTDGQEL